MSPTDAIAFGIVGLAAGYVVRSPLRSYVAAPLSELLLRRGHVKLAMRVRKLAGLFRKPAGNCH